MTTSPVRRALRGLSATLAALRTRRDAVLMLLAALLLVAALLGPTLPVRRLQVDAVAVVDITQSMNVEDGNPGVGPGGGPEAGPGIPLGAGRAGKPVSRLAQAKATLAQLIAQLPCGSRIGLAIFTEYRSFLLLTPVEVCEHQQELLGTLAQMDGRMAWAGASEIAKGINSGMEAVKALEGAPTLLFLTDGQESPPVNPGYRPRFTVDRGAVRGLIVGVGGDELLPIPKLDPSGYARGVWGPDEVLQVDPRSLGRGGSVGGEQMVDPNEARAAPLPGATPGSEHLSSLREDYLRLLAGETGLVYQRLGGADVLLETLSSPKLAHEAPARLDLRPWLGAAALLCLLLPLLPSPSAWRGRRRKIPERAGLQAPARRAMRPQR